MRIPDQLSSEYVVILVDLYRTPSGLWGRYIYGYEKKYGAHPGVETRITPDGPDVLDGIGVVEGVAAIRSELLGSIQPITLLQVGKCDLSQDRHVLSVLES